jgi:hypothetical protein
MLNGLRIVEGIKMLELFKIFIQNIKVYGEKSLFSDFSTPFRISVNNVKMKLMYQK